MMLLEPLAPFRTPAPPLPLHTHPRPRRCCHRHVPRHSQGMAASRVVAGWQWGAGGGLAGL